MYSRYLPHSYTEEITAYAKDKMEELIRYGDSDLTDSHEVHNQIFNMDYYIIGYFQAKTWLGSHAFDAIGMVQDYEKDRFGEIYTDLSSPEKVANMVAYIIGEEITEDLIADLLTTEQLELSIEE